MFEKWYYTHDGQTLGPFSAAEIQYRAAQGMVQPNDWIWPCGLERESAVQASAAIDFATLTQPASPVAAGRPPLDLRSPEPDADVQLVALAPTPAAMPDWLSDVQKMEELAAQTPPGGPPVPPDWLNDFWQAEKHAPATIMPGSATVPDWLEDVRRTEEPAQAEPASAAPVVAKPVDEAPVSEETVAAILLTPDTEPSSAGPETAPPAAILAEGTSTLPASTQVAPGDSPGRGQPHRARTEGAPGELPPSAQEAFQKARTALQLWLDLGTNQKRLVEGNFDAILADPQADKLIANYQQYGPDMTRKLREYLEWLVGNRRKFYSSRR